MTDKPEKPEQTSEFEQEATQHRTGLVREFWDFLKHNKKWWLLPIIVVILLIGAMVVLTSTGVGPFIYAMF
jgi:hypothetical protein